MEAGARQQLAAIAAVTSLLGSAGLDHWLFGGWAVDFYVGEVTRPHGDIDFAVRLRDRAAIGGLLETEGWRHAPNEDEDGGTGYERDGVRLELTFLVEGDRGEMLIAFRGGPAVWSDRPFGRESLALAGVRCPVVPPTVLNGSPAG